MKYIECEYNDLSKVEYILNNLDIKIRNKEFLVNVKLEVHTTKEKLDKLSNELSRNTKLY